MKSEARFRVTGPFAKNPVPRTLSRRYTCKTIFPTDATIKAGGLEVAHILNPSGLGTVPKRSLIRPSCDEIRE